MSIFAKPGPTRASATMTKQPFVPHTSTENMPLLRAFVDETGDRGYGKGNASPIYGMPAVLVDEKSELAARAVLRQLRAEFNVPADKPLSCKDHVKTHDRRVHVAKTLAKLKGVTLIYVVANKDALEHGSYRDDITLLYNVVAYSTLQRILWAARWHFPRIHKIEVRFGHVKKHDPTDTHNYFQIKKNQLGNKVPFGLMTHLGWVDARQYEMSQVADLYAGMLKAATWPNEWGNVEGSYITEVWHQVRNPDGCPISLGFQYKPMDRLARELPWWSCDCAKCAAAAA